MKQVQQARRGNAWTGRWQFYTAIEPVIADITIGGFNTDFQSFGAVSGQASIAVSGFNTEVLITGGGDLKVGGFSTDFSITGTTEVYAALSIPTFITTTDFQALSGSTASIKIKGFNTDLKIYGAGNIGISRFTTTTNILGSVGGNASLEISSFKTTADFQALTSATPTSAKGYGELTISSPIFGMTWGILDIGGFNTTIISGSGFAQNNDIAYAINIKTAETTKYTNYDFDYIVRMFGKYYGVKSDGLYLLEGQNDNGTDIEAKIKTSIMDFGTALHKRVPAIYLDTEYETIITPSVENIPSQFSYNSEFTGRRTKLGRGLKGRFWAFEVTNVHGNEMKLGSLEAFAEVKSRKV